MESQDASLNSATEWIRLSAEVTAPKIENSVKISLVNLKSVTENLRINVDNHTAMKTACVREKVKSVYPPPA